MSCYYDNILCFVLLDTGATSSAVSFKKVTELNLQIFPTKNRLVQVDESYLEVCGEVHFTLHRDNLPLKFSALAVKKMGFDIIGGTNFLKENDIYCRLSTNKIIIKGIHCYNSTPYVATLHKMVTTSPLKESKQLLKAVRTETLLPGESQEIMLDEEIFDNDSIVEIEPRREAPLDFPRHQFQKVTLNSIRITNDSQQPIKIKKNTPLCNIKRTVESNQTPDNDDQMSDVPKYVPNKPDLNLVQLDPGNQFTAETRTKLKDIILNHSTIFQDDLPGYNNFYGQVEATFEWATKSRPQPVKARQPDYNKAGNKLFNDKCLELL